MLTLEDAGVLEIEKKIVQNKIKKQLFSILIVTKFETKSFTDKGLVGIFVAMDITHVSIPQPN